MKAKKLKNLLGERIKARCVALSKAAKKGETKINQAWLAASLGISSNAVSKWAYGESDPTLGNIRESAKYLKCTVGYLIGEVSEPEIGANQASANLYTEKLETENARLQEHIVSLQVTITSQRNIIAALEKDARERPTHDELVAARQKKNVKW